MNEASLPHKLPESGAALLRFSMTGGCAYVSAIERTDFLGRQDSEAGLVAANGTAETVRRLASDVSGFNTIGSRRDMYMRTGSGVRTSVSHVNDELDAALALFSITQRRAADDMCRRDARPALLSHECSSLRSRHLV
jgi:hypothetical protein